MEQVGLRRGDEKLVDVLCFEALEIKLMGVAVPVPLFRRIFPNAHKSDPYRLAVRYTLMSLAKACRRLDQRAKVWFELGNTNGDELAAFNDASKHCFNNILERNRLAGVAFADKKLALLQAANLAVFELLKAALNRGTRRTRKPLSRMWKQSVLSEFDEECLVHLRDLGGSLTMSALEALPEQCQIGVVQTNVASRVRTPV